MHGETKILFGNIKNFRKPLLFEAVNDNAIIDAINDRKLVYLYYAGDDTIMKGYRIVVPFVLGTTGKGNKVLRAWQIEGNSDSYIGLAGRNRKNHEYHIDNDGSKKIGWRLFNVDKISSWLPKGTRYIDDEGNSKIPPLYNPNDEQMSGGIIAAAPEIRKSFKTKGFGNIEQPDVVGGTVQRSDFDTQAEKFKQFYNVAKQRKQITAKDVEELYKIVKNVKRKSPNNYIVVVDSKDEFDIRPIGKLNQAYLKSGDIPVGNLRDLYNKFIIPTIPKDDKFFKQQNTVVKSELEKPNMEQNNMNRKTFFKT